MTAWIYSDADNTLWDTDALFAKAQLVLLSAIEALAGSPVASTQRLEFVREYDQAIAVRHHLQLRYPPALLIRALNEGIRGVSPDSAAQRALSEGAGLSPAESQALEAYLSVLSGLPPELEGVRSGLQMAHDRGIPVYVISEGPIETVRSRLRSLDLDALTSGALSAEKTPDLYRRLKQRALPQRAVMIGDQLDRDIGFANEAGLRTILVSGNFTPSWLRGADTTIADAVVQNFRDAVRWVIDLPASASA